MVSAILLLRQRRMLNERRLETESTMVAAIYSARMTFGCECLCALVCLWRFWRIKSGEKAIWKYRFHLLFVATAGVIIIIIIDNQREIWYFKRLNPFIVCGCSSWRNNDISWWRFCCCCCFAFASLALLRLDGHSRALNCLHIRLRQMKNCLPEFGWWTNSPEMDTNNVLCQKQFFFLAVCNWMKIQCHPLATLIALPFVVSAQLNFGSTTFRVPVFFLFVWQMAHLKVKFLELMSTGGFCLFPSRNPSDLAKNALILIFPTARNADEPLISRLSFILLVRAEKKQHISALLAFEKQNRTKQSIGEREKKTVKKMLFLLATTISFAIHLLGQGSTQSIPHKSAFLSHINSSEIISEIFENLICLRAKRKDSNRMRADELDQARINLTAALPLLLWKWKCTKANNCQASVGKASL